MEMTDSELERVTLSKVTWRLIPFMALLYFFCILDRVNVSVAALTMNKDLGFTEQAYGLGAGIFFIGYFFFEIPSNLMLERVGARRWIARITFTWGILAAALAFVPHIPQWLHLYEGTDPAQIAHWNSVSFSTLRVLLGIAEAGFFPGMILYLTYWFPNSVRSRAAARFVLSNVVATIVGGPLGAQLLKMNGLAGLQGWQWLFLMEGIPSFLLGFAVLAYMTDRPQKAEWLKPEEREWLIGKLAAEQAHREKFHPMTLKDMIAYPRVFHLAGIFFLNIFSGSGLGFFGNLVLKQRSGWSNERTLWLNAIPPVLGAVALIISATHSDRKGERRTHVVTGLFIAAIGIALAAWTRDPYVTLGALAVIAIGGQIQNGPFWGLTSGFLSGAAAAGGIALINSIGNSGSFFGPFLMGALKDRTHDYETGIFILSGTMLLASILAFKLPPDPAAERAMAAEG